MIRIVLADDHLVVREGLAAILALDDGLEVVGEAASGPDAVETCKRTRPDVVLLDLQMPGDGAPATIAAVREASPKTRVIVFTAFDDDDLIVAAVRAGIDGYLLKGTGREELFAAIRTVAAGGSLLQPAIASKLLARVGDDDAVLTPRESEVIGLLAKGLSNKEIAGVLDISERTAKFHVSALLRKLDAENRTEAVTRAVQLGIVEL